MRQSPEHPSWSALSAAVTAGASCVRCGSREDLVAHHRIPRRLGGLDVPSNLEPVCRNCHPAVEREAVAKAERVWERPEWPEAARRRVRRPRLIRP